MNTIKVFLKQRGFSFRLVTFNRTATTKKKIPDPNEEEQLPSKLYS